MTEQRSQITGCGLAWTGLLGGLGGAINAWLCYVNIPVPMGEPWYFSLIHGTIWGSLVGYGVWKAQRTAQNPT